MNRTFLAKPAEPCCANGTPAPSRLQPSFIQPPSRGLRRFTAVFAIYVCAGFALLTMPGVDSVVAALTAELVRTSGWLINVLGGNVAADGAVMRGRITGFAVRMANGCNGMHALIVLWSAILAFPAPRLRKGAGLLLAFAMIHAINLVRFISLFFIGQYAPAWLEFAHTYLWESMIMLDGLLIFWAWAQTITQSPGAPVHE